VFHSKALATQVRNLAGQPGATALADVSAGGGAAPDVSRAARGWPATGLFATSGSGPATGLQGRADDTGGLGDLVQQRNNGSADMKSVIALICIGILIFSWNPASLIVALLVLILINQDENNRGSKNK
jgi:hypothetical protein